MRIESSALMQFLMAQDPLLYAKVLELRERVEHWLSYVPVTFPNYTRHTELHSDEIIHQVSKLLWTDESAVPATRISAGEAYVVAAAAYLHDTGMVVTDREKLAILGSVEWETWVREGGGA